MMSAFVFGLLVGYGARIVLESMRIAAASSRKPLVLRDEALRTVLRGRH